MSALPFRQIPCAERKARSRLRIALKTTRPRCATVRFSSTSIPRRRRRTLHAVWTRGACRAFQSDLVNLDTISLDTWRTECDPLMPCPFTANFCSVFRAGFNFVEQQPSPHRKRWEIPSTIQSHEPETPERTPTATADAT